MEMPGQSRKRVSGFGTVYKGTSHVANSRTRPERAEGSMGCTGMTAYTLSSP